MSSSGRPPNIAALRAFEAVVRHGSVMQAARELNLTDGAVSRAVRDLEERIGFALFERGNRQVRPSAVARTLAQDVRRGLDDLSASIERARRVAAKDRPLVLSCEPTFLIRWLIPRLAQLQAAVGGERELRFVSAGGAVPFAREGIDLAIRRTDFAIGADVRAEPFLEERIGPVCKTGPAEAEAETGGGVVEGVLLHTATRPDAWDRWSTLSGTPVRARGEVRFEHFYQSLQAAAAGAGLAIGPVALVADDLAAGALAAPHSFVKDGTAYALMGRKADLDTAAFEAVAAWLACATRELADPAPSGA